MTAEPIIAVDELRGHMRRRGFEASELVVDLDAEGGVIVRARFEPAASVDPTATWPKSNPFAGSDWEPVLILPAPTAKEVAAAVSHEQGMNVWKGALCVLVIFAGIFVAGALGWI